MGSKAMLLGLWCSFVCALTVPSCGDAPWRTTHGSQPVATPLDGAGLSPAARALIPLLQDEFSRLGRDPAKVAAMAPLSPKNAVFDLAATVTDADGAGPALPTGVELSWTERCIGDYDQNSIVGISDLTPLAMFFSTTVLYDPPALHAGLGYWPQGVATDDGGSPYPAPPAGGSGAQNWRRARVDGDGNGQLGLTDLTPLAAHWGERLGGYIVYRRVPTGLLWEQLPNPTAPGSPYTVPRSTTFPAGQSAVDPNRPVRYAYSDTPTIAGEYSYYVVAYDDTSDTESAASNRLGVKFVAASGAGQAPAVLLSGTPASGDVPLDVTWDASATVDDGPIAKFEWDMDGNPGTWEYDSGTTPTLQITYNTPGSKTQWVRVTDNDGFTDTVSAVVTVTGGNEPPVAVFTTTPMQGEVPLTVDFDASNSQDNDGTITQYVWDYEGDGFPDNTSATPTAQFTYIQPGNYAPSLTVTDNLGATDSTNTAVAVHGWAWAVVDAGVTVEVKSSAEIVAGAPAIAYHDAASGTLRFCRATQAEGLAWGAPLTLAGGGGHAAGYWNALAIIDSDPAVAYLDKGPGNFVTINYIRANDMTGTDWPTTITTVVTSGTTSGGFSLAEINGRPALCCYDTTTNKLMYTRSNDATGNSWPAPAAVCFPAQWVTYSEMFSTMLNSPAICYLDFAAGGGAYYIRAQDADGGTWPLNPTALCTANACFGPVSGRLLQGAPAAVYYGLDSNSNAGLCFLRSSDLGGSSWKPSTVIVPVLNAGLTAIPDLGLISPYPAIAYALDKDPVIGSEAYELYYIQAVDAESTSWQPPELVDGGADTGLYPTLLDINGHPGIAYVDQQYHRLMFAYRY